MKCQTKRRHAHWNFPEPIAKKNKSKWFTYNGDEWGSDNRLLKWVINQKCKTFPNSSIAGVRNCCFLCGKLNIFRFCLLLRSKRGTNHVYNLSINILIVGGRKEVGNEMRTVDHFMVSLRLYIHACAQCAFMHGTVFVCCICMCVWILFTVKEKGEAPRPAAS